MINEYVVLLKNGKVRSLRNYADTLKDAVEYCERIGCDWVSITNRVTGEFQIN